MIRRPPRSTLDRSSAASDVYKRQNRACPAQIFRLLVHFAGRGAMDIDGLGESMAMTLLQKGLVEDLADVYSIRKEQLMELDRIGDKMAQNLVDAIARSKARPLPNFIYALGIR